MTAIGHLAVASGSTSGDGSGVRRQPRAWSRFKYPQSLYKYAALLASLVFVAWSLDYLEIDVGRLPGIFGRIGDVLVHRYFPPDLSYVTAGDYIRSVLETLQMSYLAMIFGVAVATPLAWFASFNMTPSKRVGYAVARFLIMGCRSVHEMIWTILLVAVLGFGLFSGTLALTLFCIGFAGKLFAEAIEAIEKGQVEAVRSTGAGEIQVFVFGVLPQVRVAWTGITIYTWDVVFRAATVVGFFGAGGMGWFLRESVQTVQSKKVAAVLLSIILIVLVAEIVSAKVRSWIARAIA